MKLNKALLLRSSLDFWALRVPRLLPLYVFLSCRQRRLAVPVPCERRISAKSANPTACGQVAPGVVLGDLGILHLGYNCPRRTEVWATEKAGRAAGVSEGMVSSIKKKEIGFPPYYQLQPLLMWCWTLRNRWSGPGFCPASGFCSWVNNEKGPYLYFLLFSFCNFKYVCIKQG